jgi:import inner membrane translocase subunit TIM16
MARFIAQIIVIGSQAVMRAFTQALRQEYQATAASRRAASETGKSVNNAVKANAFTGLSLQEAKQILNIDNHEDITKIRDNYNHLFKVNDKSVGGSFYLQSKIVRAKERIELEIDQKIIQEDSTENTNNSQSNSS